MTMLSVEAQIRYLVQWFNEWSDLQRSDFLPVMAEKYSQQAYVNGIVNSISNVDCRDKPMSLFECRVIIPAFKMCSLFESQFFQVKLFKEWFTQWNMENRESFRKQVIEIDPSFAAKLNGELQNGLVNNHSETNGEELLED